MLDPIEELDLKSLRSGNDQYSRLKLSELTALRPPEAVEIAAQLAEPEDQRFALKWVMRGLNVEMAVAKVGMNKKMETAIRDNRRAKKELREGLGMTDDEIAEMKSQLS